ncbi:MAG TPA: CRISPR-associated helicase Cas3' [Pyrinomonadaceae bacterium]
MRETRDKLLAKSTKNGKEVTLQRHLEDTEKAAREVFNLEKRWGKNWCRFFKIYEIAEQERFLLNLRIAALFHDIGKANEDFQTAVSQNGFYQQTIRHEHLSALILHLPEVREWLSENKELDLEIITAAVLSHHIKACDTAEHKFLWMQPKGKFYLTLFDNHNEINKIFDQIKDVAQLSKDLRLNKKLWNKESPWEEAENAGFETAIKFRRGVKPKKDEKRLNLLLAIKAGLIASDAVASGLVREGEYIEDWINEKVHTETIKENEVATAIIDKRAEIIFKDKPVKWNDFQLKSATLGKRALLLAACGAGKTIAAWKWAEAQSQTHEIGKVIFLYPTRGTATEGFKDYVGFAPEAEASLLHGSAKYELEEIRKNPEDEKSDKDYETNARLFALGFWGKKYFSATVDQFLSFLEHSYSSLCLLPVLADSAIIIDEVHSFDKRMFETLVCFLKQFDIPVLCMTATLPTSRKDNLENIGLRVYPNKEEQAELKDLEKSETHPRYNLEIVANQDEAMKIAVEEFSKGKRILWVVNTVKRCQNVAKEFEKQTQIRPLIYHSRFRLKDRKDRHEKTIAAFKQISEAKIAITTQVCEMSLDLDADVLITEIAPIPSLVQRFGRSNRHLEGKTEDFRSRLVAYIPEKDKPYNQKEDLETALAFLKDLPEKDISQRYLAEMLMKHSPEERQQDGDFAPFLSSGYYAVPGNFREIDDFTNPCILWSEDEKKNDLNKAMKCLEAKKLIDAFVISVPKQFVLKEFEKPKGFPKYLNIADARFYDEDFGFMTQLENENE